MCYVVYLYNFCLVTTNIVCHSFLAFFPKQDRSKFYLLLREGVEKFCHRILAFCLMTYHVHQVIQVGEKPWSGIMRNVSFRYIHNNPVRANITETVDQYAWSSHRTYLGLDTIPWLPLDLILSQFSKHEKRARKLSHDFVLKGVAEEYRAEFQRGIHEGRILGDDRISEEALNKSEEKFRPEIQLHDVVRL